MTTSASIGRCWATKASWPFAPTGITPEEQQAMDEAIMDLMDQADPDADDR
jgi:hypothetical protein